MDQIQLLTMMMVFGDQGRGAEVVKRAARGMLPGVAGFALNALAVRKELKLQDEKYEKIIKQQDETYEKIIKQLFTTGVVADKAALQTRFSALHDVFVRLPAAAQDRIFVPL